MHRHLLCAVALAVMGCQGASKAPPPLPVRECRLEAAPACSACIAERCAAETAACCGAARCDGALHELGACLLAHRMDEGALVACWDGFQVAGGTEVTPSLRECEVERCGACELPEPTVRE